MRKRPYNELSGGERQLVIIARVLAQEPKVILLDEPISHLDVANQGRFLTLVKGFVNAGMTILSVLHDPTLAFRFGDELLFAKKGYIQKAREGSVPWESSILSEVYGIPIKVTETDGQRFVTALEGKGNG